MSQELINAIVDLVANESFAVLLFSNFQLYTIKGCRDAILEMMKTKREDPVLMKATIRDIYVAAGVLYDTLNPQSANE